MGDNTATLGSKQFKLKPEDIKALARMAEYVSTPRVRASAWANKKKESA